MRTLSKLLFNEDGTPTERTGKILAATPMGRFGESEELLGALLFLVSKEAAGFITGVVIVASTWDFSKQRSVSIISQSISFRFLQ